MVLIKNFEGQNAHVVINGRLDMATAMKLEQELLKEAQDHTHYTLDMAGVDYISSAGIRALLALYRVVSPKGGTVTLRNTCRQVREILVETEFDELFNL